MVDPSLHAARISDADTVTPTTITPPGPGGSEPAPDGNGAVTPTTITPPLGETVAPLPEDQLPPREGLEGLGRYEDLGAIGHGGMGKVYRVRDLELNRELALKVMRSRRPDPNQERRFIEEAQVEGQLQHPGIPPVHDLARLPDGRPYYTMKLIQGHTLARLLSGRPGPAHDRPRFVADFRSICQTLAYAHARGVVHRDLKPANVMVGAFGEVQVMDWGLAKVLGRPGPESDRPPDDGEIHTVRTDSADGGSRAGTVMGTPAYMPPEQALGQLDRVDERADVFALGAILCEILTGRPPYVGPQGDDVYLQATRADLADAVARLETCGADAELIALALRCLAPDPAARPRHAGEVAAAVSAHLASVQERLRAAELAHVEAAAKVEHERQRRRLAVALAAAVVALIGLAAGGWIYLDRLRTARREATAHAVDQALRDAESWRGRAQAAPLGDLSAWAEALASARQARDLLRGEDVADGLRRRVDETLAAIEAERDQTRADVAGCLASTNRYRVPGIVPPPAIELRASRDPTRAPRPGAQAVDLWPNPDYSSLTILRSSVYFDLSGWKPIPPGTTPSTAGRCEPALCTRVVDLIRKENVTQDNSKICFQFRTEGFEVDLGCPGRRSKVCGSVVREQLGGSTRPVLIREIEVDLTDVSPGQETRVVIHAVYWNGFQYNAAGKQWAGLLALDNLSEGELAVKFPEGCKPTSPPTLYVFQRGSPKKDVPAHTQSFNNPLDQDWCVWRPRDIRKDSVYQIEWNWIPDRAG